MPKRLSTMELDKLKQQIRTIGVRYSVDREKRARRLFIEERAVALKDDREREFEIKSMIAERMPTSYSSIHFTGSAQLGFSVHKDTLFKRTESDLDVACVDLALFQQAWTDVIKTSRAFTDSTVFGRRPFGEIDQLKDQILRRGMIRIGIMPYSSLRENWRKFEIELSELHAAVFKSVSLAIYMNEYAFCWKQDSSLARLETLG